MFNVCAIGGLTDESCGSGSRRRGRGGRVGLVNGRFPDRKGVEDDTHDQDKVGIGGVAGSWWDDRRGSGVRAAEERESQESRPAAVVKAKQLASPIGPPEGGWLGQRVVTKRGTVLRDKKPAADNEKPRAEQEGDLWNDFPSYRVEQVDGDRLKLEAVAPVLSGPGASLVDSPLMAIPAGPRGWVTAAQVVPFDRAVDCYAGLIQVDPKSVWAFLGRGAIWLQKENYDKAFADFNEAIRINPKDARAHIGRGETWATKNEYDKAIADFSEAIRIDPKAP